MYYFVQKYENITKGFAKTECLRNLWHRMNW